MAKYKIQSCEQVVLKTGKVKVNATLISEDNATLEHVTIWSDFPNFANLKGGDVVEGVISTKVNGNYTNHTLYPPATGTSSTGQNTRSGGAIRAAQERKQEAIRESQESKDFSIKVASTLTNAVNLALAEYQNPKNLDTLEVLILRWRRWLWENHDVKETDFPPF